MNKKIYSKKKFVFKFCVFQNNSEYDKERSQSGRSILMGEREIAQQIFVQVCLKLLQYSIPCHC